MLFKSSGYPRRISESVDLPPIAELIRMPFMKGVPYEMAMKRGSEDQKTILKQLNLSHNKRFINVDFSVQYLTPSSSPVTNINLLDLEWHTDSNDGFIDDDVIFHLLINEATSTTEFNCTEFETEDYEDSVELIRDLNIPGGRLNKLLVPKKIEPGKFITFCNNDIHRARRSLHAEFRLIIRVVETNYSVGNECIYGQSYVYDGGTQSFVNIEQMFNGKDITAITINNR